MEGGGETQLLPKGPQEMLDFLLKCDSRTSSRLRVLTPVLPPLVNNEAASLGNCQTLLISPIVESCSISPWLPTYQFAPKLFTECCHSEYCAEWVRPGPSSISAVTQPDVLGTSRQRKKEH